jgi:hypothetical protein
MNRQRKLDRAENRRQQTAERNVVPMNPLGFEEMAHRFNIKIQQHQSERTAARRPERKMFHTEKLTKWDGRQTAVVNRDQAALANIVQYYQGNEYSPDRTQAQRAKAARKKEYYQQYLDSSSGGGGGQSSRAAPAPAPAPASAPTPGTPGGHYYDSVPTTPYDWNLNQPGGNWRDDDYS